MFNNIVLSVENSVKPFNKSRWRGGGVVSQMLVVVCVNFYKNIDNYFVRVTSLGGK